MTQLSAREKTKTYQIQKQNTVCQMLTSDFCLDISGVTCVFPYRTNVFLFFFFLLPILHFTSATDLLLHLLDVKELRN